MKCVDNEKKKLRHEIIQYKKNTDNLKENLKKKHIKMNTLMSEIEHLVESNK